MFTVSTSIFPVRRTTAPVSISGRASPVIIFGFQTQFRRFIVGFFLITVSLNIAMPPIRKYIQSGGVFFADLNFNMLNY